jgi:DNA-directed RNA polymerase subunit RPC12/RpoP
MIKTDCPHCGEGPLWKHLNVHTVPGRKYQLYRCSHCGRFVRESCPLPPITEESIQELAEEIELFLDCQGIQ